MKPQVLPSQSYVWLELASRFEADLRARRGKIWRLCGLIEAFKFFPRQLIREGNQGTKELAGALLEALALELEALEYAMDHGIRTVGRPPNHLIPYLGPALLDFFLRYHVSGGRHSVVTSIGGVLTQTEAGPLFEFIKAVIEPLNKVLVDELGRMPLSPSNLARYALGERKREHLRIIERANQRHRSTAKTVHPKVTQPDADLPGNRYLENMFI
jgi:hypothetical protein